MTKLFFFILLTTAPLFAQKDIWVQMVKQEFPALHLSVAAFYDNDNDVETFFSGWTKRDVEFFRMRVSQETEFKEFLSFNEDAPFADHNTYEALRDDARITATVHLAAIQGNVIMRKIFEGQNRYQFVDEYELLKMNPTFADFGKSCPDGLVVEWANGKVIIRGIFESKLSGNLYASKINVWLPHFQKEGLRLQNPNGIVVEVKPSDISIAPLSAPPAVDSAVVREAPATDQESLVLRKQTMARLAGGKSPVPLSESKFNTVVETIFLARAPDPLLNFPGQEIPLHTAFDPLEKMGSHFVLSAYSAVHGRVAKFETVPKPKPRTNDRAPQPKVQKTAQMWLSDLNHDLIQNNKWNHAALKALNLSRTRAAFYTISDEAFDAVIKGNGMGIAMGPLEHAASSTSPETPAAIRVARLYQLMKKLDDLAKWPGWSAICDKLRGAIGS